MLPDNQKVVRIIRTWIRIITQEKQDNNCGKGLRIQVLKIWLIMIIIRIMIRKMRIIKIIMHNTGPRIRGLHTSSLYQWQTLVCYTGQCHHHQHHGGRKKSQQTKSKMKIWYFVWVTIIIIINVELVQWLPTTATLLGHANKGGRQTYQRNDWLLIATFALMISMICALKLPDFVQNKRAIVQARSLLSKDKEWSKKSATRWSWRGVANNKCISQCLGFSCYLHAIGHHCILISNNGYEISTFTRI